MLTTNRQRVIQVYDCVKTFHNLEILPPDLPNPQHINLLPTLRPYQIKAVKWMLSKELYPSYYEKIDESSTSVNLESAVLLPKGGILADEMGLGKTVEVLACILSNPRIVGGTKDSNKIETEELKNDTEESKEFEHLQENKVETIVNSGEEFDPTEDGIVEIKISNDNSEDLKFGVGDLKDSGCVINDILPQSPSDVKEIQPETGQVAKVKRKRRKKVRFDEDDDSSLEVIEEFKEEHMLGGKRKRAKSDSFSDTGGKKIKKEKNTKRGRKSYPDSNKDSKQIKPKRASALKAGETFTLLKSWYDNCLSETSVRTQRRKQFHRSSSFQCCCVKDIESDNIVECPNCNTWQHAECVGYDETQADYQYYCFQCWQHLPSVVSSGTMIISPEAISQQWVSEIEKHVKKDNLRVLVYEGVRVNGYIQPHDLASYDIVITTYQVLTRELNYTEPVKRNLRHAKRFFAPTSPLLFVHWWRLCLDEAQMVEGSSCRAAEMAKKFTAENKWAVTGTPIQKAVNDLVGLMEFLAGNEYREFLELMSRDWRSLLKLVPRVLWRTQMKDVLAETGVPPQTVDTHLLEFSEVEKYFYQCTHTECSQQFVNRINRFVDLNVTLKSLDRKQISNLLNPLLKLRQACLHPQAVRGKFVSVKKTMRMEDLLRQMVTGARLDAEQALRQLVAALNGTGALHVIRQEWSEAAAAYRAVLHLEHELTGRLKIDSLQRIHTMHNLAEVLDGGYDGVPPTLRDDTMRDDIKALELRYLGKREAPMAGTKERIELHEKAITEQLEGATLGYSEWWLRTLEWSSDREELLDRVKSAIQLTDAQQKNQYNNLANKLKSLYVVRVEVAKWLAELDRTREEVRKWVTLLRGADKDVMAAEALMCHLPQGVPTRGRTRCQLCKAENVLKSYEALLFEEKSKEKRKNKKRNLPGSSDWTDDKDMDNKEVADLVGVNVNTFETSRKGGFKASPFEKILKTLAAYGRQRQVPVQWTKEAGQHLAILERVKKEFLDLNLMWRQIFDLVDAKDELNMCKMRLRLPCPGEEEEETEKKKRKMGENQHIIALYRVEPELLKLSGEKVQFEALLKKKIGTLCYLENLQKEGAPAAICPVCRNDLTEKWSVLQCGHSICLECLSLILKPQSVSLLCPQCRQPCNIQEVSYVENRPESSSKPQEVKGSYSTKVDAVVSQTLRLISQQRDVKILVFSAWEKVLDLLAEAFQENSVTFRRLKSGKLKQRQFMKEFKTGDVTVLLLPLRSGAKGLNLVEATHVFLVEPILNPAEELQAVGRVHRIGQTKPTVVHRFIVRETIEERILAAVAASGAEQWSDDCVTLQQLLDLFSSDLDLSLPLVEPGPSVVAVDSDDSGSGSESGSDGEQDTMDGSELIGEEDGDSGDEL